MLSPAALQRLRQYLAGLWAGSAVMVAVTATVLNRVMLDKLEFGKTVSVLFRTEAVVGLLCGLLLPLLIGQDRTLDPGRRRTLLVVVGLMLACIAGYFMLQPMMAALREAAGAAGVMAGPERRQFGQLHGLSMLLYLVQTLLSLFLLFKTRK